jgi:hypothetical protein
LKNQVQELTVQLNESNRKIIIVLFLNKFLGQSIEKHAKDERDKYVQIYARTHDRFVAFEKKQLDQMRRLLTILTSDQRKLLTGKIHYIIFNTSFFFSYSEIVPPKENSNDSSTTDDSQLKESPKTTNNDDDTKLHSARYHKTETDWEELLAQVCSSPMKE